MGLDIALFRILNSLAGISPTLDAVAVFFAQTAGPILVGIVALWLIIRLLKKDSLAAVGKSALYLAVTMILSRGVLTELIRLILPRTRPFAALPDVTLLISHDPLASFPSGHAAFYFAVAFGVLFLNKKLGLLALIVATLIGVSRVIVGVHYPSDILGGAAAAFVSAWALKKLFFRKEEGPEHG